MPPNVNVPRRTDCRHGLDLTRELTVSRPPVPPVTGSRMLPMPVPRPPVTVDQGLRNLVNGPYPPAGPVTRILPPQVRAAVQVPSFPAHAPASWWRTQWDAFRLWLKRVTR